MLHGYIGIDISKDTLDFAVHGESATTYPYNKEGISKIIKRCRKLHPERIVVEFTGKLEYELVCALQDAKLPVAVVNPKQVRDFAKAIKILAKTDRLDAIVLARYGEQMKPPITPLTPESQRLIKEYTTRRNQLLAIRQAEKNRLQQMHPALREGINRVIQQLDREIEQCERDRDQQVDKNDQWKDLKEHYQQIKGIGQVTANALIAEMPELGNASHKQIAALAGLAPVPNESGKYRGYRAIRGGRASIRKALYMPALTAIKYDPTINEYYQRLVKTGKKKKVAIVAVMRKILVWLNAIARQCKINQNIKLA